MTLMETAQLLGNFGEVVGAIAVVATLAYLAIQIRQSNVAAQTAAIQGFFDSYSSFSDVQSDVPLIQVIRKGFHIIAIGCFMVNSSSQAIISPRQSFRRKTRIGPQQPVQATTSLPN